MLLVPLPPNTSFRLFYLCSWDDTHSVLAHDKEGEVGVSGPEAEHAFGQEMTLGV